MVSRTSDEYERREDVCCAVSAATSIVALAAAGAATYVIAVEGQSRNSIILENVTFARVALNAAAC